MDRLPQRGAGVAALDLPLPPARMPLVRRGRPLKRWRYIGAYGPELMLCAGDARIGAFRQRFWAVAEPGRPVLARTTLGRGGLRIEGSRALVDTPEVRIDVEVEEDPGVESIHASGAGGQAGYVWTRKQAGIPARGEVVVGGRRIAVDCEGAVDDTAGYHQRRTQWRWSTGVGRTDDGRRVAWNLVTGVNDEPKDSERAIWIDGEPFEPEPVRFADDLSEIAFAEGGALRFGEWSSREDRTNVLVMRSYYRQPFGTFTGELPGGARLAEGYGVMEWHDVRW